VFNSDTEEIMYPNFDNRSQSDIDIDALVMNSPELPTKAKAPFVRRGVRPTLVKKT
jgi:hypothetical protein